MAKEETKGKGTSAVDRVLHFPPFLFHVALVLVVGWIAARHELNLLFVFTVGFLYLYHIEGSMRQKIERKIRSEERKTQDRKGLVSDTETGRWLNAAIEAIWPVFLEQFVSQKVLMALAPWFMDKYKPWTAKKVILQETYLGRTPPVFSMFRAGRHPTDGDHLVLEMAMKFVAATDMSAVIAVQMKRRVGLGLWTKLHISNMQFEGKLRVGVRFVSGWPVVQRLRLCFSEAPILRMVAKPIFNYGVDVTDLPGIASWVDRMVTEALEKSLVAPNMLVVDVNKLVGSMMAVNKKLQSQTGASGPNSGDWFSAESMPPSGILVVEILDAKKLKPSDVNGKADPYVKIVLGTTCCVTKVRRRTLEPEWHEQFQLPLPRWDLHQKLNLRVRDKDRFRDDDMGHKEIALEGLRDGQRHEMVLSLEGVKTGEIRIALTVDDFSASANVSKEEYCGESSERGDPQKKNTTSSTNVSGALSKKESLESLNIGSGHGDPETDEELPCEYECKPLDVGCGQVGAVLIVTPGVSVVKKPYDTEQTEQKKPVQVDGESKWIEDDSAVEKSSGAGLKKGKMRRFWAGKGRKVSSEDSSSGELAQYEGETGTEVLTKLELDSNELNNITVRNDKALPSSDELQTDLDFPKDNRVRKIGKGFMKHAGRTAHSLGFAIKKLQSSSNKKKNGVGSGLTGESQVNCSGEDHRTTADEIVNDRDFSGSLQSKTLLLGSRDVRDEAATNEEPEKSEEEEDSPHVISSSSPQTTLLSTSPRRLSISAGTAASSISRSGTPGLGKVPRLRKSDDWDRIARILAAEPEYFDKNLSKSKSLQFREAERQLMTDRPVYSDKVANSGMEEQKNELDTQDPNLSQVVTPLLSLPPSMSTDCKATPHLSDGSSQLAASALPISTSTSNDSQLLKPASISSEGTTGPAPL